MTDTPRTDAIKAHSWNPEMTEHARTLEIELAAKTEECEAARRELHTLKQNTLEICTAWKRDYDGLLKHNQEIAQGYVEQLSRAREETRGAAAKVCDGYSLRFENDIQSSGRDYAESCAKAIRALALSGHAAPMQDGRGIDTAPSQEGHAAGSASGAAPTQEDK